MTEHSHQTKPAETTPAVAAPAASPAKSRTGRLKFAFLYVLVAGLVISALISVVAILIGEFNSIVQKAIFTTVNLVFHSIIVLLIVLADDKNQLGKSIIPTTLVATIIASMLTSSMGIWGLLGENNIAGRLFNVYALLVGAAFLVEGVLRLRLQKQIMHVLAYVSIALVSLLVLLFIPWILFFDASWVNDLYYRLIGAAAILAVTSVVITAIMNRISIAQKPELSATKPVMPVYSGAMRGVTIAIGVIVAFIWFFGLVSFVYQASTYNERQHYQEQRYDRSDGRKYNL